MAGDLRNWYCMNVKYVQNVSNTLVWFKDYSTGAANAYLLGSSALYKIWAALLIFLETKNNVQEALAHL